MNLRKQEGEKKKKLKGKNLLRIGGKSKMPEAEMSPKVLEVGNMVSEMSPNELVWLEFRVGAEMRKRVTDVKVGLR